ncbi:MAG: DUF6165 family protein [Rhizobiaceae bacterium]
MSKTIKVEIAPGELLDKQSILEIKAERIADPMKRANVLIELDMVTHARAENIREDADLSALYAGLKRVNEELWEIEDAIRGEESAGRFGERFIELARSVYRTNDRRAAIKREINMLTGSRIVEEKSYKDY